MVLNISNKAEMMHYPILLKLLLVFIFFLPLRAIQIPIGIFGFEINPARIASALITIILFMSLCIDARCIYNFFRSGKYRNQYVLYFFIYTLFSIAYYYLLVGLGKTILFGSGEASLLSFLRSWRGRPFAQLLAFTTYGIIPYYLVQYYARYEHTRKRVERIFKAVILILLYFACVQVITYMIFKAPLIGRQFLEYKYDLGNISIFGIPLYRVNSLGGEPRDFGTFLLGAIPFYAYICYGRKRIFTKVNLLLMIIMFFLTTSNSAFLAGAITLMIIIFDTIWRKRIRLRFKYIKYAIVAVLIGWLSFRIQLVDIIGQRSTAMYESIGAQLKTSKIQPLAGSQGIDLVTLYYIINIREVSPFYIFFGSGYSNFVTPLADLLNQHFHYDLVKDYETGVVNLNTFASKLFVEGGLIGLALYGLMLIKTLKLNSKLLYWHRINKNKEGYMKALFLRFSFIAFFVGGAIQSSYTYFIIMGLIVGWLNGLVSERKSIRQV